MLYCVCKVNFTFKERNMKKTIVIFLLLCFAISCFAACESDEGLDSSLNSDISDISIEKDENNEYLDKDGNYIPKHEIKDMEGRKFTIIVRGEAAGTSLQQGHCFPVQPPYFLNKKHSLRYVKHCARKQQKCLTRVYRYLSSAPLIPQCFQG